MNENEPAIEEQASPAPAENDGDDGPTETPAEPTSDPA